MATTLAMVSTLGRFHKPAVSVTAATDVFPSLVPPPISASFTLISSGSACAASGVGGDPTGPVTSPVVPLLSPVGESGGVGTPSIELFGAEASGGDMSSGPVAAKSLLDGVARP